MRPFALGHLVPPALRDVLVDFAWDRRRLFALELAVEEIAVAELDLAWWKTEAGHFSLTPNHSPPTCRFPFI